jgi:Flp pilus assembly protein TadD
MLKQELAITQNPQLRSEALITLGLLYEDQGKDGDALDAFQQVASLMPERPEPYLEMAAIHTRLGNPERAAAVLEQARKMGASSPEALLNIGISYFNRKDYGKADEMFRQVLSTPGAATADQAMAQALVGKLLLRDGKVEEAVAAMKRSLELDPNGRLAEETKDTLKALNR